ncbi:MAG TPA: choice-of-anchor R domain-containing protein [Thermoanaerobaculales bacterium]|nr:choice-of-anchor R domain-containing protein [Thermoanaerobaculales bacterium]HQL30020.1 choice-of-anchor R domain-containing protein [Thermoanaerobaculales bacterium]HQN96693.1 choice-of-anchor R domain-containing protein [Thermoanaerobaculales bacterium]HQP44739.1 choice-of-anchor R domain-containing protein [Thermoanaerobaculales bacterium]
MSKPSPIVRTVFVAILACLAAQPLLAQVTLISNLDGNDGTQAADLDELRNKGMGFTMPAGDDYILQHVTLRLETFGAVAPIVELWSDVGGLPSAVIETLTNPTFAPSGIANYDFTSSGTTLAAGTSYWVVAYGVAGAAQYNWKASSPAQTPTGLATHLGTYFDSDGPPPTGTSSILASYSVTGTVVPVELMSFSVE